MAVSFVAGVTGPVAQSTTATATVPAGARSGDLIVPALYLDEPDAVTVPAGWRPAGTVWNSGATFGEHVWTAAFDSFGSGVMTWRTRSWHDWLVLAFRGHDPAAPINAFGSATGSGTAATAPSIRTTVDGCLLALIATANDDASGTPPAAWTEVAAVDDGHYAAVATTVQARAGDTGPVTATLSAALPWTAVLFAVAPAPAPGEHAATVHVHNGTTWIPATVQVHDGTSWRAATGLVVAA